MQIESAERSIVTAQRPCLAVFVAGRLQPMGPRLSQHDFDELAPSHILVGNLAI
jgi:hypothetical protein